MIYFDNAATTDVCPEAIEAASAALADSWGNPSSLYSLGVRAEQLLEASRKTVARELKVDSSELFFTASGTESNNLALMGLALARKNWGRRIVATAYEHPSVENCLKALEDLGYEVIRVEPKNGLIDPADILEAVTPATAVVAAMAVNNETGALIDIPSLARAVKSASPRCAVHCDFVQGFMKRKSPVTEELSTLSVSGHKIHAPKGVGALYIKKGTNLYHYLRGGGQEHGIRPGTENVAYAAAMAAAVKAAPKRSTADVKNAVLAGIADIPQVTVNSPEQSDDSILNISAVGYKSETLLHFLEARGIFVSSGSACSRGERSHTLTAMRLDNSRIDSALRLSFSYQNTPEEAAIFVKEFKQALSELVHS